MLNKRSQTKNRVLTIESHLYEIVENSNYTDRKQEMGCLGMRRGGRER